MGIYIETKKSRKAAPVPDQKGEKEGGTKLQPPGGTTEKYGKGWRRKWRGVGGGLGRGCSVHRGSKERKHKQSKQKFDRKSVHEMEERREKAEKLSVKKTRTKKILLKCCERNWQNSEPIRKIVILQATISFILVKVLR